MAQSEPHNKPSSSLRWWLCCCNCCIYDYYYYYYCHYNAYERGMVIMIVCTQCSYIIILKPVFLQIILWMNMDIAMRSDRFKLIIILLCYSRVYRAKGDDCYCIQFSRVTLLIPMGTFLSRTILLLC